MSLDVYLEDPVTPKYGNREVLYNRNITHNLGKMAAEAGIYDFVWTPNENGLMLASQLIEPIKAGLQRMKDNPEHYSQFSAPNGWGTYEQFIPWIEDYLKALEEYPDALVSTSR